MLFRKETAVGWIIAFCLFPQVSRSCINSLSKKEAKGQRHIWKDPDVRGSPDGLVVKNPPANAGDTRDAGSVPESGRTPAGGYGSPLQYSRLENPMDRGAWWATVHSVPQSQTRLKWPSRHTEVGEEARVHRRPCCSECRKCLLRGGRPQTVDEKSHV